MADDGSSMLGEPRRARSSPPSSGRQVIGILLLLVVNIVWVASAELTRYLFIDLRFKRPFFTTYVKSCMFTLFLLKRCFSSCSPPGRNDDKKYSQLTEQTESSSSSEDDFEVESLTNGEFEPITLPSDSDTELLNQTTMFSLFDEAPSNERGFGSFSEDDKFSANYRPQSTSPSKSVGSRLRDKTRKVRFSLFREVRRMPASVALEARLARLSYRQTASSCEEWCTGSRFLTYMFMFAPLWFLSSTTYQVALCFDNVSFVTLVSSSSSLFVLIFGTISPKRSSDRFSWVKLFFVVLNLSGVAIVSELSGSAPGLGFALFSAVCYAGFLQTFSGMTGNHAKVDRFLMFGTIGFFSVIACTPLIFFAHITKVEMQFPLPTQEELLIVVANGLIGSIFADYLWIWATELTSSLISSLSLTLSIPLSFAADTLFRDQAPTGMQLLASVPIMVSFVGAALIQNNSASGSRKSKKTKERSGDSEAATLISDTAEEQL